MVMMVVHFYYCSPTADHVSNGHTNGSPYVVVYKDEVSTACAIPIPRIGLASWLGHGLEGRAPAVAHVPGLFAHANGRLRRHRHFHRMIGCLTHGREPTLHTLLLLLFLRLAIIFITLLPAPSIHSVYSQPFLGRGGCQRRQWCGLRGCDLACVWVGVPAAFLPTVYVLLLRFVPFTLLFTLYPSRPYHVNILQTKVVCSSHYLKIDWNYLTIDCPCFFFFRWKRADKTHLLTHALRRFNFA